MVTETKPLTIEPYLFRYIKKQLEGASPDQIVAFYVDKLIFHNEGYLEDLQRRYHLPNNILKIHQQICRLAEEVELGGLDKNHF